MSSGKRNHYNYEILKWTTNIFVWVDSILMMRNTLKELNRQNSKKWGEKLTRWKLYKAWQILCIFSENFRCFWNNFYLINFCKGVIIECKWLKHFSLIPIEGRGKGMERTFIVSFCTRKPIFTGLCYRLSTVKFLHFLISLESNPNIKMQLFPSSCSPFRQPCKL